MQTVFTILIIAAYVMAIVGVVAICSFGGKCDVPKHLREDNE